MCGRLCGVRVFVQCVCVCVCVCVYVCVCVCVYVCVCVCVIVSPNNAAIDGDGMIIALTFVGGHVHLRTKFVASKERLEEQEKKAFLYRDRWALILTVPSGTPSPLWVTWLP